VLLRLLQSVQLHPSEAPLGIAAVRGAWLSGDAVVSADGSDSSGLVVRPIYCVGVKSVVKRFVVYEGVHYPEPPVFTVTARYDPSQACKRRSLQAR
jgi:hypothetical protein